MNITASNTSKSKLFHYENCRYTANILQENKIVFKDKQDARSNGYIHCSNCSIVYKSYKQNKVNIDDFLRMNNLKMYLEDDSMYIENTFSSWKITTEDNSEELKLFHGNTESYYLLEKRDGHIIHNYHVQKYKGNKDILSILKYIIDHDNWKSDHVINSYKKLPTKTKNQKKAYRKAKKRAKRIEIRNLYNLIDRVSLETKNK